MLSEGVEEKRGGVWLWDWTMKMMEKWIKLSLLNSPEESSTRPSDRTPKTTPAPGHTAR